MFEGPLYFVLLLPKRITMFTEHNTSGTFTYFVLLLPKKQYCEVTPTHHEGKWEDESIAAFILTVGT
jgi:hypothetical protein